MIRAAETAARAKLRGPWLLLLIASLSGCSANHDEIARVGGASITVADFEAAALANGRPFAALGDSAKWLFAEEMIKRQLVIEAAKRDGAFRDSTFLDFVGSSRDRIGRDALLQSLSGGPIAVSEAEILETYRRLDQESHVSVVLASSRSAAEQALKAIRGGADFGRMADRYNSSGLVPPGGDAGWLLPGALLPSMDEAMLSAPIGEIVGPIDANGQGWFLLRVEGRRPARREPLETVRGAIVERLRQRKQRATFFRGLDRIRADHVVTLQAGAGATMGIELLGPLNARGGRVSSVEELGLPDSIRAVVLATYRGGAYTLGDALADLIRGGSAPNLAMQPQVERWIEAQTLERAVQNEARQRHLVEEPALERALRAQTDNGLAEAWFARHVTTPLSIDEAAVRAEFEASAPQYARLRAARIAVALFADSASAGQVLLHGGHAGSLAAAVAMGAPGTPMRTADLAYPNENPQWAQFEARFASMQPGEMVGPFHTEGGWVVIELLDRQMSVPTWEALDPSLRQHLQTLAVQRQRELRYRAVTDSLRRIIPVTVHRDRIQKLTWPLESRMPPGIGSGG
ncbi:MAG: hypothetical protein HOP12_11200 [Candidatus Eisenbacteria bacterium]|uniref:PpiC domain-containing protein n=1 Tax=Eiseniibacteriota bacterium TaxID=2212470 RepID=A0A849SJV0_UNCEI|nr:hypothetical protein [Candidatus Eisenbacteria bacterium]